MVLAPSYCCFFAVLLSIVSVVLSSHLQLPTSLPLQCQPYHNQKFSLLCKSCEAVVTVLQAFWKSNHTQAGEEYIVYELCTVLKIEESDICRDYVNMFGPEIFELLSYQYSPQKICAKLKMCPSMDAREECHDSIIAHNDASKPAPVLDTHPLIKQDQPLTGKFWHVSDIHYDWAYRVGSLAVCDEPLCCRNGVGSGSSAAAPYGSPGCDSPKALIDSALSFMAETPVDFVLWTGDDPPHDMWAQNRTYNLDHIAKVSDMIRAAFPTTPVLPSFGNHEAFPIDQFSMPPNNTWLMDAVAQDWHGWLPTESIATFQYGGYYTALVSGKTRVISLNLMYCDPINLWVRILDDADPAGQLQWFAGILAAAQAANENVYIIAHIPFGIDADSVIYSCIEPYNGQLHALMDQYNAIIVGSFFGHTHTDSFRIVRDVQTKMTPVGLGFVNPSITPFVSSSHEGGSTVNPSARLYSYDLSTGRILDFTQYYMDLNATSVTGQAKWNVYYQPMEAYHLHDMSPASYDALVETMHDRPTFDKWWTLHYVGYTATLIPCDEDCHAAHVCNMKHIDCPSFQQCMKTFGIDTRQLKHRRIFGESVTKSSARDLFYNLSTKSKPKSFLELLHYILDIACTDSSP